jgi:hypothetical protein
VLAPLALHALLTQDNNSSKIAEGPAPGSGDCRFEQENRFEIARQEVGDLMQFIGC